MTKTVIVMPLQFKREPYKNHSYSAVVSFDGQIYTRLGDGYIGIHFSTNLDGRGRSYFSAGIGPSNFEDLARMMVEVDPQAAIRAFGAAMRDVEIQKRGTDTSAVVAA
jgi:hypothetical protein